MYGALQMGKAPDLHREVRIVPPVGPAGRGWSRRRTSQWGKWKPVAKRGGMKSGAWDGNKTFQAGTTARADL